MSSRREAPLEGRAVAVAAAPVSPGDGRCARARPRRAAPPAAAALARPAVPRRPRGPLVLVLIDLAAGTDLVSGLIGTFARLAIIVGGGLIAWWIFQRARTRVMWRVRERLVVSYLFIGVVPALLIAAFFLFSLALLGIWVSAYLFRIGVDQVVAETRLVAGAAVEELERSSGGAAVQPTLDRVVGRWQQRFPGVSLVVVPRSPDAKTPTMGASPSATRRSLVRAGAWSHLPPPDRLPSWIGQGRFEGIIAHVATASPAPPTSRRADEPVELVVRVAVPSRSREWSVVVDVPLDEAMWSSIEESTGIAMIELSVGDGREGALATARSSAVALSTAASPRGWIRRVGGKLVAEPYLFVPFQTWTTSASRRGHLPHPRRAGRDLPAPLGGAGQHPEAEHGRGDDLHRRPHRRALHHHRGRRPGHGLGAGALDHPQRARALHRHRAPPPRRPRPPHPDLEPRSARRAGRVVQRDDRQPRDAARAAGREAAPRRGAPHRARDPDVAAAAAGPADAGPLAGGALRARPRGRAATTTTSSRSHPAASGCSSPTSPARARRRRSTWRSSRG